ncbi:acetolactate synthase large subunit [Streptomyces sp. Li-HN-5-11]|uniref:acetolactate synthase large subunit n=1 Tax=Streptomyces sp. Li-HN-5-11 TaxID=3075432 RepID=UPI0028AE27AD|nr:acetolactate synthase large subunit [Streptomyces sp. Li-HN-5-11]WNM31253.1 acetolactate synthase large subunit [Streptomyces sp. Li-HN-5-11]
MNGAQAVVATLRGCGVEVYFANPGTSEMHLVAALDEEPTARAVPCLFEGVATGAADGYGRMSGRPAATLLHLGPGLGNGLANLHNARRAATPLVNLVGDHATHHKQLDAPLESDIDALAGTVSGWVHRCRDTASAGVDTAAAVAAAMTSPGQVATLILPADISWSPGASPAPPRPSARPSAVPDDAMTAIIAALRSAAPTAFLLGGTATRAPALRAAARIAAATGARLLCETFPARLERGAGLPALERLGYLPEGARAQLQGLQHLVLVGAHIPVSFFAYPGQPGLLAPGDCHVHTLAGPGDDVAGALAHLTDLVPHTAPATTSAARPQPPTGELTGEAVAAAVGALLPEGAIVVDEANTSGLWLPAATAGAPQHDWLSLTGGAIGQGLPLAAGAAIACPGRPVVCLEADGSAMYTLQALWTIAREELDVTTVVYANQSYSVLEMEYERLAQVADSGHRRRASRDLLDLSRPNLNFAELAQGMGVPTSRATTAEEFTLQLAKALAEPGPHLIEARVPPLFTLQRTP